MSYANYIKDIGRGAQGARSLSIDDAQKLYAAMLDGGVPDLELGAIILALRVKGEAVDEMLGFMAAVDDRTETLEVPHARVRPVVLPTYNGSRKEPNLTPLLALMLQRFGIPVLVHGLLEGMGRVTTGHILRELGIMPAATTAQAQTMLETKGLAFAPLNALSPGIHSLLGLRARMGVRSSAHSLVKMIDPFRGEGVLVAAATHPEFIDLMRGMLTARGGRSILLQAGLASLMPIPSGVRVLSMCMKARLMCCLKLNTTVCVACPTCLKPLMRRRPHVGRARSWTINSPCPNPLPTNWPAASTPAATPKASIRPRPSLPFKRAA